MDKEGGAFDFQCHRNWVVESKTGADTAEFRLPFDSDTGNFRAPCPGDKLAFAALPRLDPASPMTWTGVPAFRKKDLSDASTAAIIAVLSADATLGVGGGGLGVTAAQVQLADANRDGQISTAELEALKGADADGDGAITATEFVSVAAAGASAGGRATLHARYFGGSGKIGFDSLKSSIPGQLEVAYNNCTVFRGASDLLVGLEFDSCAEVDFDAAAARGAESFDCSSTCPTSSLLRSSISSDRFRVQELETTGRGGSDGASSLSKLDARREGGSAAVLQ